MKCCSHCGLWSAGPTTHRSSLSSNTRTEIVLSAVFYLSFHAHFYEFLKIFTFQAFTVTTCCRAVAVKCLPQWYWAIEADAMMMIISSALSFTTTTNTPCIYIYIKWPLRDEGFASTIVTHTDSHRCKHTVQ